MTRMRNAAQASVTFEAASQGYAQSANWLQCRKLLSCVHSLTVTPN